MNMEARGTDSKPGAKVVKLIKGRAAGKLPPELIPQIPDFSDLTKEQLAQIYTETVHGGDSRGTYCAVESVASFYNTIRRITSKPA